MTVVLRSLLMVHRDLALVAGYAILAAIGIGLGLHPLIRTVLAIPLALFLPGYALVSALFAAQVLPSVERFLMALGASIAIVILTGLALAAGGLGLSPVNWAFALATLTIFAASVAFRRRTSRGLGGPRPAIATLPRMSALMLVVAGLIVTNVVLGSRLFATEAQSPAPPALWMVPLEDPNEARLGMRAGHHDNGYADYRIRISSSGIVLQEYVLKLNAGETWERIVEFADEVRQRPVVARLYEGTNEAEIRFVVLQPVVGGG